MINSLNTRRGLYRAGGISALAFVAGYATIIGLFVLVGTPPKGGEAWLNYGAGKTNFWWGIIGLSVLTDLLLVPIALSLYSALKELNRNIMLAAVGFVGLFVVLDLAVTWPNYTSLVSLSSNYAAATNDAQRLAYVAAANRASSVLTSPAEAVLSILTLSVGILITGAVMFRSVFGRRTGSLGLTTGVLGMVAVVGAILGGALATTIILVSVLTAVWVLLVGIRLFKLPMVLVRGGGTAG